MDKIIPEEVIRDLEHWDIDNIVNELHYGYKESTGKREWSIRLIRWLLGKRRFAPVPVGLLEIEHGMDAINKWWARTQDAQRLLDEVEVSND